MVDAVLNGTIGLDQSLNLDIDVRDIDMKRVEHKLPYEVEGHGTFEGHVTGFINAPVFDGTLDAKSLMLNGVDPARLRPCALCGRHDLARPLRLLAGRWQL